MRQGHWFAFGLAGIIIAMAVFVTGCQRGTAGDDKQARLIGAENMQLKANLQQRDKTIEKLKADISKCTQEKDALENQTDQKTLEMITNVTKLYQQDEDEFQKENEQLKAQIESLKKKIEDM